MLTGWPFSGTVRNPSKIGGRAEVEKLLDALNSEACKWVRLTDEELRARVIHNKERQARGEAVYHPRRTRTTKALTMERTRTSSTAHRTTGLNGVWTMGGVHHHLTHMQEQEKRGKARTWFCCSSEFEAMRWVADRASSIRTTGQAIMVDGDQDIKTYYDMDMHTGAERPWRISSVVCKRLEK
ncbi:hypothetical protein EDD15DRAFT_2201059 [Pisolithus albus]|nr:hypothetical protein EDD15DRAFT_2201059 [Pisolithus albus]